MRNYCIPFILALVASTQACGDQSVTVTCTDDTTYFKDGECVPKPVPCGGCEAPTPVCDEASDTCVGCLQNTDCQEPTASLCDSNHSCQPCGADADCAHLGDLNLCIDGRCGECTLATEADQCGDTSCNPATLECTDTERASVDICQSCVADSECDDDGAYCVPMRFSPEDEDVTELGGFCLKEEPAEPCPIPYRTGIQRTTLSGLEGKTFCGVAEPLTTCRAVLDLIEEVDPKVCGTDTQCGVTDLDDGLCRQISGLGTGTFCTYACQAADQCPGGKPCPGGGGYCGQP